MINERQSETDTVIIGGSRTLWSHHDSSFLDLLRGGGGPGGGPGGGQGPLGPPGSAPDYLGEQFFVGRGGGKAPLAPTSDFFYFSPPLDPRLVGLGYSIGLPRVANS